MNKYREAFDTLSNKSYEEIRKILKDNHIRGIRLIPESCPISIYLEKKCATPNLSVIVSPVDVVFEVDDQPTFFTRFETTHPMKAFINDFDRGRLPEFDSEA